MSAPRPSAGFTLIELLVAIAVLGVVMVLAVPSFEGVLDRSRMRAVANDLAASAYLARSEAIKRNTPVSLCSSANGTSCTGNWNSGWIVLAGTTVVQRGNALPQGFKVMTTGSVTNVVFQPTGFGATAATLTVCKATPTVGSEERVVTIDVSGRADVRKTTNGVCT
jgi:type IV fimbrial biogenesis protein FimT